MRFSDLDKKMRVYELCNDNYVIPDVYIIARLDGRNFTKLTRKRFKLPFDDKFHKLMINTTIHLMNCGFKVIYANTFSDEISLLFDFNIDVFSRKIRKYCSILSGEASSAFSLLFNDIAVFDCRVCSIPESKVLDYFKWRNQDSVRNSINSYCYWTLRDEGYSQKNATKMLYNKTFADKNELLFSRGINFNDIPSNHKNGTSVFWKSIEKTGTNPLTNETTTTTRNMICYDDDFNLEIIKNLINIR